MATQKVAKEHYSFIQVSLDAEFEPTPQSRILEKNEQGRLFSN